MQLSKKFEFSCPISHVVKYQESNDVAMFLFSFYICQIYPRCIFFWRGLQIYTGPFYCIRGTLRLHSGLIWVQSIPFNKREFQKSHFVSRLQVQLYDQGDKRVPPLRTHTDTHDSNNLGAISCITRLVKVDIF